MTENQDTKIAIPVLAALVAVILVFCYYMGYTGGAPQSGDWNKHNAVLHDLTTRRWPVYYDVHERSMLTYYIAQYLVPSFAGKLCVSFVVTQYMQYVWNAAGIILIMLHLFRILKAGEWKKQLYALLVFIFYGGMLLIAQAILSIIFRQSIGQQYDCFHFLDINGYFLQYRSNLVCMRWVFAQCIVPWIIMLLLYEHRREIEHYAALLIPVMLFGTLSMLGLAAYAGVYACKELVRTRCGAAVWKKIFSPWNIMTLLSLGAVLFIYFSGNVFSDKPEQIGLSLVCYEGKAIWIYLIFCVCMYGVYAICVFRQNKRDTMYWITVVSLTVIPFFRMGSWNDFCMGVSIPAQFLLMVFVLKAVLNRAEDAKSAMMKGVLIACLWIGAIYPFGELYQTIKDDDPKVKQMADMDQSLQFYADRFRDDIGYDMQYNYYTYDLDKSIFVRYLARKDRY